MSRGQYAVFGNCQAPIIADFLETSPRFSRYFEKFALVGVHEMSLSTLEEFKGKLGGLKLFIYQNVKRHQFDTDFLLELLPGDCIKISIPSLFFNAYNPEINYIRKNQESIIYHDRLHLKLHEKYSIFEDALLRSKDYYPKEFSEKCLDLSFSELRRREVVQNIKIPISDYIADRFKEEKLFHVMNHPSQALLRLLCVRILKYLGMESEIEQSVKSYTLDQWQFPIYLSHFLNLGLKFNDIKNYIWDGEVFEVQDFFRRQLDFYSKLPRSVLEFQNFEFSNPVLRSWDLAAEFSFPVDKA